MSYRDDYIQYRTSLERPRPGPPEPPTHSDSSYRSRPNSPYRNERPYSGYYDRSQTPATITSHMPLAEPSPPYHASDSPHGTYVDESPPYIVQEKPYKKPSLVQRNRCCRYLCCACCLPVWARWILWIIIIGIIIVVVVFAIIFSQFKVPTFQFNGITNSTSGLPEFTVNGTRWTINVGLQIGIDNPNIESATLSDMNATAFYPTNPNVAVGGGFLASQFVSSNAITNFTFPFSIDYDPTTDLNSAMLEDIATKCGLLGGTKQPLTINYKINLAVKVLFITVHPSVSSSASFDCPIEVKVFFIVCERSICGVTWC
ncbi:hypothetical protein BGW37DRAFT_132418 [Umbelopsis sp. PMI_123]|nr:hypothetical protein BGW37DRAFT_132418 [Umbelopsis sp. PMI_123]